MLDPRVESYRELMEDVKIHNERVDKLEAVLGRYYRDTTEIKNDICALEETVDHLRLNVSAPVQACVTEETVENVKASKRGRKVSKTPVS